MNNAYLRSAAIVSLATTACFAQPASEVFFSLSRTALSQASAPVDAKTIERKEIESSQARNPVDLLQYLPSVATRKMNGPYGSSVISMRGYSSKQTAVLFDDVKLPTDLTGTVDFSIIPVSGIDRIEVLPGGWSGLYGANAEGGVVQIMSARLQPGSRILQAESGAASYGGRFNYAKAGFAGKRASIFISGTNEYSDGFQENAVYSKNGLSGVFSCALPEAGKITVRGFASDSKTGLPTGTPVPLADWNGKKERAANSLTDNQNTGRNFLNAGYETSGEGPFKMTASAGFGNNLVNAFQWGSMTRIGLQNRTASAKLFYYDGILGLDYERSVLNSPTYGNHSNKTYAVYGQKPFTLFEGFELTPALRYDANEHYNNELSPKLAAVYAPSFAWKFSMQAGKGFQAPTFADLYDPFVPPADRSPNLKPETSLNYQAGARWNSSCGFYSGVNVYYSDIKNRIALNPAKTWAAYNIETALNRGIEAEAGYKTGGFRLTGAYTVNESLGRSTGGYKLMQMSPLQRASLVADLKTVFADLLLKGRYVGAQYTGRNKTGLRLPGFLTADLLASKVIGAFTVSAGAENISDKHYAETADPFNGYYPQPGRVWKASVKIDF